MVERKLLRRVAAILYHRRAGFSANGMGVWRVPEDRMLEIGGRMAAVRGISHCYQRPTYATGRTACSRWPTGARSRSATRSSTRIADEHDLHGDDRAVLYSSTEYKKVRLRYFIDDYARWEADTGACSEAATR